MKAVWTETKSISIYWYTILFFLISNSSYVKYTAKIRILTNDPPPPFYKLIGLYNLCHVPLVKVLLCMQKSMIHAFFINQLLSSAISGGYKRLLFINICDQTHYSCLHHVHVMTIIEACEKKHVNIQFNTNLSVKCYRQREMKNDFPEIKSKIKSYSITFLL